jgi:polysaccharide pyruvyl transferase WcaK-like protein
MPYCDPRVFAEKDQRTYDEYIAKLGRFTAHLIRNGYLVALLAGDAGIDPLAVDDLQKALKGEGVTACCQSLVVQSVDSCEELWRQMATLDYVVVCRFHAVVFAHLLNTPVIALSHHPKVASLMSDIGLSKYCVDIRSFEVEPLMETFQALVDDSADVKHRMADRLTQYSDQLTGQLDELFPLKAAS